MFLALSPIVYYHSLSIERIIHCRLVRTRYKDVLAKKIKSIKKIATDKYPTTDRFSEVCATRIVHGGAHTCWFFSRREKKPHIAMIAPSKLTQHYAIISLQKETIDGGHAMCPSAACTRSQIAPFVITQVMPF